VDGDPEARRAAVSLLGAEGDIYPDTAPDGEVAIERLATAQYDAVVSDFVLPKGNGIDLLRTVRGSGNPILFILLADRGNEEVATDAILNGADTYLPRSGDLVRDLALVRAVLAKRRRSERRRSEEAGERYRLLVDHISDGYASFRVVRDEAGAITGLMVHEVNRAFEAFVGMRRDALLAKWAPEVIPDREGLERQLLQAIGRVARAGGEVALEGTSAVHGQAHSAVVYSPEPGTVVVIIAPGCRPSEAGPTKGGDPGLLDIIPALITIKDTEGRYRWTNRAFAELMGTTPEALEGTPSSDVLTGEAADFLAADQEVQRTGSPVRRVVRSMVSTSGHPVWLEADKMPLKDANGNITGVVTFGLDITHRRETEEALTLAQKKLNLLGSITRHDLLNQLTALVGYLEIAEYKGREVVVKDYIHKARRAAESMDRIIQFSRDYERMGQQRPEWSSAREMAEKGITAANLPDVRVVIDLDGLEVYADRMLEKVFHNLADNARRHGGASSVRFSAERRGEGLCIICQDNGKGIDPDRRERMFDERFGRGLCLVREILAITGMRITETSAPGEGARFEIEVPPGGFRNA